MQQHVVVNSGTRVHVAGKFQMQSAEGAGETSSWRGGCSGSWGDDVEDDIGDDVGDDVGDNADLRKKDFSGLGLEERRRLVKAELSLLGVAG